MEKPASPDYPILDVIKRRWSPRAFEADRPVEAHKLRCLFEAARWAASSFNEQPWVFFVARQEDGPAFEQALSCLVEGNQQWARHAPVLMLTATRKAFTRNGKPNRVHQHDLGLAMGNLTVQATAMGLFLHQMAGIVPARVRQVYALPEQYEPQTGCAIGYPGEPEQLDESLREAELAERQRKALGEFVFNGRFGEASPMLEE